MNVKTGRSRICRSVEAPPSKSYAHRMLICAALASGQSTISGISESEDMAATMDCIRALGAAAAKDGSKAVIDGIGGSDSKSDQLPVFPCRESGSTLRFFIPIALAVCGGGVFTGTARLIERGIGIYEDCFAASGVTFEKTKESITAKGTLNSGYFKVPGDISSQFISGLMFTLPLLSGKSIIEVSGQVESRAYLDITVDVLRRFGVVISETARNYFEIEGDQQYQPRNAQVEGDWSNAAFLYALKELQRSTGATGSEKPSYGEPVSCNKESMSPAGYIMDIACDREPEENSGDNDEIEITGLNMGSIQGDKVCVELLGQLRAPGAVIDISGCPDLGPILFAMAAVNCGGHFTGTRRLRIKESDRVATMCEELAKFGKKCVASENELYIPEGILNTPEEPLCGHNDHRIAMSMAVLSSMTGGVITGAEAVRKSFPDFFDVIKQAGIKLVCEE